MGSMVYLSTCLLAIYAGLLYSLIWWVLRTIDPTKEDRLFDIVSLLITTSIAAITATILLYTYPKIITYNVWVLLLLFASITAVIREVTITLYRKI